MITCSLCGFKFKEETAQKACCKCPWAKGCSLICCPQCGFEMPLEPAWCASFKMFFKKLGLKKKYSQQSLPENRSLLSLANGQKAKVISLDTEDQEKLLKLMAIGIFPGRDITLIQKFPSYVFQLGHSQFAIDQELAKIIFVNTPA